MGPEKIGLQFYEIKNDFLGLISYFINSALFFNFLYF